MALLAVTCITIAVVAVTRRPAPPRLLCMASALPDAPQPVGATWYWLEHRKGESLLVRMASSRTVLARAQRIAAFSAAAEGVAWIAKSDGTCRVLRGGADGSDRQEIWSSGYDATGVWTDGHCTAWIAKPPPPATPARGLPPLGPVTEVWRHDGREATRVAALAEGFRDAHVVGALGDRLYMVGLRGEGIPVSVIYEVPLQGPPRRLVGEYGPISATLRSEQLVWTAPSRESNSLLTACVRTMRLPSGPRATIADWLPGQAMLYDVGGRLILCAGLTETAWSVDEPAKSGSPVAISGDYWPLAAGGRGLLAVLRRRTPGKVAVWLVPMP